MSDKELNRINVIQAVIDKRMRRRDAAHQLNLTERQVQRLMNRYRESGVSGLASLRRGSQVITGFLNRLNCGFWRCYAKNIVILDQLSPQKNSVNDTIFQYPSTRCVTG